MRRELFDLGQVMARLEEDTEGLPYITLLAPASETLPAQEVYITSEGVDGLVKLAQAVRYWRLPSADSFTPGVAIPGELE